MSDFALKMMFPLLVLTLLLLVGGVFFAATGLMTPFGDKVAAAEAADEFFCGNDSFADSMAIAARASLENPLPPGVQEADIAAGDALFKGNCAQCHAVNDVVVGPALAGISTRRPEKWLLAWVKNSSQVVASGDEYAVKIFNQYQKQQMPSFDLSDQEIRQIIVYIEGYRAFAPSSPQIVACR